MSENKKATKAALGELHGITAKYFQELLNEAMSTGETLPAAMMGNILRFLHDNDVVADSDTQNVLEELRRKAAENRENVARAAKGGSLPTDIDYQEVLAETEGLGSA